MRTGRWCSSLVCHRRAFRGSTLEQRLNDNIEADMWKYGRGVSQAKRTRNAKTLGQEVQYDRNSGGKKAWLKESTERTWCSRWSQKPDQGGLCYVTDF